MRTPKHLARARAVALAVLVVASASAVATTSSDAGAQGVDRLEYQPPVQAPVVDPFRRPSTPYASGNRGVEYLTPSGGRVVVIGSGTVVFAGSVGGRRWVSIVHPDGLRSTYGPLGTVLVSVGDSVRTGQPIATSLGHLHLGVRSGRLYLDPALLFAGPTLNWVRLVPVPME